MFQLIIIINNTKNDVALLFFRIGQASTKVNMKSLVVQTLFQIGDDQVKKIICMYSSSYSSVCNFLGLWFFFILSLSLYYLDRFSGGFSLLFFLFFGLPYWGVSGFKLDEIEIYMMNGYSVLINYIIIVCCETISNLLKKRNDMCIYI